MKCSFLRSPTFSSTKYQDSKYQVPSTNIITNYNKIDRRIYGIFIYNNLDFEFP